jgi:hypothetical protein
MRIDEITLRSLSSCSPGFELPKSKESGEMAKASNIILVQGAWAGVQVHRYTAFHVFHLDHMIRLTEHRTTKSGTVRI